MQGGLNAVHHRRGSFHGCRRSRRRADRVAQDSHKKNGQMITGHFGFAAAVKSREVRTPLWALMFATVWLDIVFVPLFLGGIETLSTAPGARSGYGGAIIHADYTHSLVGAVLLSALLGWLAGLLWGARSGMVIGVVSFSHWVLDLIVHRPDLPILPDNLLGLPKLGLGLWRFPIASASAELLLLLVGAGLYWRAALKATRQAGQKRAIASSSAALLLVFGLVVLLLDVTGIAG